MKCTLTSRTEVAREPGLSEPGPLSVALELRTICQALDPTALHAADSNTPILSEIVRAIAGSSPGSISAGQRREASVTCN